MDFVIFAAIIFIVFWVVGVKKAKAARVNLDNYKKEMEHRGATMIIETYYYVPIKPAYRFTNLQRRNIYVNIDNQSILVGELVAERDIGTSKKGKFKTVVVEFKVELAGTWEQIDHERIGRKGLETTDWEVTFSAQDKFMFRREGKKNSSSQSATVVSVSL